MFLPQNMTDQEKSLAAEVARGILAKEQPSTPTEEAQSRSWAEQVAAEMIWAARDPGPDPEPDPDAPPEPVNEWGETYTEAVDADAEWELDYLEDLAEKVFLQAVKDGLTQHNEFYRPAYDILEKRVPVEIPPRPR